MSHSSMELSSGESDPTNHPAGGSFRLLAEAIPQIVWVTRRDGFCEFVNQRWYEYTGLAREQALGWSWLDALHPDDQATCRDQWAASTETGQAFCLTFRMRRHDGQYRWFLSRGEPWCDDQSQPIRWFGTVTDIDDQKRAEVRARHGVERFRRIVEAAHDGILETDLDGTIVYANARMAEMLGYESDELVGRSQFDLMFTRDVAQGRALFQGRLMEERSTFEWRWPRRDGSELWTLASCGPIHDPDGRVAGTVSVFADLSDHKLAQHALRDSEERLRLALDAAQLGMWEYDPATGKLTWDARTYQTFGIQPGVPITAELLMNKIVHPDDVESVRRAIERAFDPLSDGAFSAEYRIFLADGRVRWILVTGKTDFHGNGFSRKPHRLLGIVQDVTRRHRNEKALREADQRKNNFLAVLAHELRSPLSTTLNSIEILRLDQSPETITEATDLIERQTQHMIRLVEELLEVSRIARGKIRLQRVRCNLTNLVRQTVLDYRSLLQESGLTVDLQLPDEPLWAQGDTVRLAQVIANLLQNARKFTDVGGQVTIRLAADPQGRRATLVVRDTGIGMTEETLARLFTPFSQAEGSFQRSHSGLGLGLSLVKGLVDLHGGTVWATSEGLGFGAELTVELPLDDSADE